MSAWQDINSSSSDDPRSRDPAHVRAMLAMSAALASPPGGGRGDIANCFVAALMEVAQTVMPVSGIFARAKEIAGGRT